jgi:uncharacterized membrane protein YraQ (UPF0718 family)
MLVLLSGPILGLASARAPRLLPTVDGFILGSLGGLVFLQLLPQAVEVAGGRALLAALFGLMVLSAMERWAHIEPDRAHGVGLVLAVVGLIAHTILDGMAVHGGGHEHGPLAEAVIIHRLPVAVGIWWLLKPRYGAKAAGAVLAVLGLTTLAGYGLGQTTLGLLDGEGAALFSAFVSGALVHVLFHRAAHAAADVGHLKWAETLGLALGVGLLLIIPHHETSSAYSARFLDLALESAPAVLLGFLMAGVVVVALPRGTAAWLRRGPSLTHALKGTVFGIPIPICSCGVVPLYQGLIKKGAPPTAALAFLIATPELGIESLFLSVPLLGGELTAARLVCALIAALVVGYGVGQLAGGASPESALEVPDDDDHRTFGEKTAAALRYGLRDVVGDTAAWIVAGLAVAATVDAGVLSSWMASVPFGVDVLLAAVVGLPLYVCASGATPLAAALLVAGLSPGAAVAFLLAGPATNVTTFGVLSQLHSRRVAVGFGLLTATVAVVLGIVVNLVLGDVQAGWVHGAHDHEAHGAIAWTSLVALCAVFGWAVLREGPTAFLRPVLTLGDHHSHDHAHGHDHHGHDHHDHDHHGLDHHDHDHHDHDHGHHGHDHHDHHEHHEPAKASPCGSDGCC